MITIIVLQLPVEYNINQMKNILKLVSMLIFSSLPSSLPLPNGKLALFDWETSASFLPTT